MDETNTPHVALTTDDNQVHYVEKIEPPKITITYAKNYTDYPFGPLPSPKTVPLNSDGQYIVKKEDLPNQSAGVYWWSTSLTYDIMNYVKVGDILTENTTLY